MNTYLISHTNPDGSSGIGQRTIEADTEQEAREQFEKLFPQRRISSVALKDS